jgi:hypothetical protein
MILLYLQTQAIRTGSREVAKPHATHGGVANLIRGWCAADAIRRIVPQRPDGP